MAAGSATILEVRLEPDGLIGRISCPPGIRPAPGQYLMASGPDARDPLPVVLYPSRLFADSFEVAPPLPPAWSAGANLGLRGPLGKGFNMPPTTRRLALASLDDPPHRLLILAHQALAQGAAVVMYARSAIRGLPEDVEVLPPDLLPEAANWADFLALDARITSLGGLRERLGLKPYQQPACTMQVLVIADMPCSGLAECGVCAVPTRAGWALACEDGPVFDFNQLEG
jgi:hypothetical protein